MRQKDCHEFKTSLGYAVNIWPGRVIYIARSWCVGGGERIILKSNRNLKKE